jgi:hypothetical protein
MITFYPPATEVAMRQLFNSLGERERRLYAGAEILKLPHGGLRYLARLFDCDPKTIRRGIRELEQGWSLAPGRSRKKGGAAAPA